MSNANSYKSIQAHSPINCIALHCISNAVQCIVQFILHPSFFAFLSPFPYTKCKCVPRGENCTERRRAGAWPPCPPGRRCCTHCCRRRNLQPILNQSINQCTECVYVQYPQCQINMYIIYVYEVVRIRR